MLKVMKKCCNQCLFTKNKIVSDERKAQLLRDCKRDDHFFICHKASLAGETIVCSGYQQNMSNSSTQIAERLGMINWVNPNDFEA